jgi:hypothetical protein
LPVTNPAMQATTGTGPAAPNASMSASARTRLMLLRKRNLDAKRRNIVCRGNGPVSWDAGSAV